MSDLTQRLINEAHSRIGLHHSNPSVAALSVEEMHALEDKYQTSVLLEAFRRTGGVVKKDTSIVHSRILTAIANLAARVLSQDTRIKPTPKVHSKPRPEPVAAPKIDTDCLRHNFQDTCTFSGDWTLTEADVMELLNSCSAKDLYEVFKQIGRFDNDEASQQRCFTALQEAINGLIWEKELTQV